MDNQYSNIKAVISSVFFLLFTINLLASGITAEPEKLNIYSATYKVSYKKYSATTYVNLSESGNGTFTYSSITKPNGIAKLYGRIIEKSTFLFDKQLYEPISYDIISRRPNSVKFDWVNNTAETRHKSEITTHNLEGGELDLLTLQLQLATDLRTNTLRTTYQVINKDSAFEYEIEDLGIENVNFLDHQFYARKIKQQRNGSSRHTLIWFAPELDYRMVKVEHYKKNELNGSMFLVDYRENK